MLMAILFKNLCFRVGGTYISGSLTMVETQKSLCYMEFKHSATVNRLKELCNANL